ncbi:hypothetical protein TNCV_2578261 [Trichonephila clavipes]|nr:hypothetical protein TNCV_2578261 [Trichonephila clavipes]
MVMTWTTLMMYPPELPDHKRRELNEKGKFSFAKGEAGTTISQAPAKRCQFEQFQLYYLRRGEISGFTTFFFIGYIVRASNKGARKKGRIFPYLSKMYKNALKEDLIRVVEDLDGTVESTDTIVKLKTKIENSSTFEK